MVCDGIAGVGASGNTPEKKPVQQAQPQKQEEASLWDEVVDGAEKVCDELASYTIPGRMISSCFDPETDGKYGEKLSNEERREKMLDKTIEFAGKVKDFILGGGLIGHIFRNTSNDD